MAEDGIWMVRAGKKARFVEDFIEGSFVAIGWNEVGSIGVETSKPEITARLEEQFPNSNPNAIGVWSAQLLRYHQGLKQGDPVATYDPGQRFYFLGTIASDVELRDQELGRVRTVQWESKVARDELSVSTRNSLGAISTLFLIPNAAAKEMRSKAVPLDAKPQPPRPQAPVDGTPDEREILDDAMNRAEEFIEDRIARLDWEQMQDLVAGVLEAMGYRARVAAKGADRGVDIFASPDGLGLEEPRIFVEVKHRPGTSTGSQDVRAFLGGRQQGDRCLYVSTGGFTKDARYEAERSSVPVTLITLPDLRQLVTDYYDDLDTGVATLIPLERIYWPAS